MIYFMEFIVGISGISWDLYSDIVEIRCHMIYHSESGFNGQDHGRSMYCNLYRLCVIFGVIYEVLSGNSTVCY